MPKGQPGTKSPRKSRATGKPPGRPPLFSHPDQMQPLIDAYFAKCDTGKPTEYFDKRRKTVVKIADSEPYTMEGLALALGFATRQMINDYIKRPLFTFIISRAKTKIANQWASGAFTGRYNDRFATFMLIANAGYPNINKTEINIGIGIDLDKRLNQANTLKLANKTADIRKLKEVN